MVETDIEMTTIDQLVEALIEREGGYVNNAADRGGATCLE